MSMSKGTSHYNRVVWEDSQFPILCQTCLGDNPYLRMMQEKFGAECKVCQRPFTVFRWCPGAKMRYKKTEICQVCSRAKNVCQTCLLDLNYGLPVQVRDHIMHVKQDVPANDINREYYSQQLEKQVQETDPSESFGPSGQLKAKSSNDVLTKLSRNSPYYKRNRPHICSFWVKGECKRGEECPFRHEKPTDPEDPLSDQNIKDRYFGVNDPVADKILKRVADMPKPTPPEDKQVTTVYVGNIGEVSEQDLHDYFYQFGEIRNVTMVQKQNCSFVTYTTRQAAEAAVEKSFQKLVIRGQRLTIRWGKSQAKRSSVPGSDGEGDKQWQLMPVPGLPVGTPDYFNLGTTSRSTTRPTAADGIPSLPPPMVYASGSTFHYPSQDPSRMGSSGHKPYKRD